MSTISSIGISSSSTVQPTQRTPEAAEVKGVRDTDGDSDDAGSRVAKTMPAATVNASGEKVGLLINTAA